MDLSRLNIKQTKESDYTYSFIIGPLPKGYGYTLANPLRRIMLSSLAGGAITGVKIIGVDHEYTTLSGLQDDILQLILKLKGVAIRCYSEAPVTAKISVKSTKDNIVEVKASDIQTDASVEVINKDYVISTVSNGASFEAELVIEQGVGFQVADSERRSEIGMIPVDGNFNPVENVQLKVSNARVGQRTDYDQIELVVTTNGVLTPREALEEGVSIFNNVTTTMAGVIAASIQEQKVEEVVAEEEPEAVVVNENVLVKNLKLSTRLKNALTNSAISDLSSLDGKSLDDLMEIKGMGQKSVDELVDIMRNNNLTIVE